MTTPNLETDQNNVAAFLRMLRDEFERLQAERTALQAELRQQRHEWHVMRAALEGLLASHENYASEHKPETEWDEYDMVTFPLWRAARAALQEARL